MTNTDCPLLHSFELSVVCGVNNWLFKGLQLDAQRQTKGGPYVINGLCHT